MDVAACTKLIATCEEPPLASSACCWHQITDAFIDDWVAATTDALPPECAITLAFFELMGGQLKASDGPVGMLGGALGAKARAHGRIGSMPGGLRCPDGAARCR